MTLVMLAALLTTASASNIPGDMLLGNFNEQARGGVNHHHQSASLTSLTSLDNLKPPDAKVNSSAYIAHHLYFAKPQIGPDGVHRRRFSHHDNITNTLVHFHYEAKRHVDTVVLDEEIASGLIDVKCRPGEDANTSVLTITLNSTVGAAPKSSFMKRVAREGAILIGDMRWNCTQDSVTQPFTERVLEVLDEKPHILKKRSGDDNSSMIMIETFEVLTKPAGIHECFDKAEYEFYIGSPEKLIESRKNRTKSLLLQLPR